VKLSDQRPEDFTFSKGLRPFETPWQKKARLFSRPVPALQGGDKENRRSFPIKVGAFWHFS